MSVRTSVLRLCLAAVSAILASAAPASSQTPEFRAFWVDVFHEGMQNAAQIDAMLQAAQAGRYNAIIAEVLGYHDNQSGSHGAYWKSNIVARSSFVKDDFDPLAYMIEQAHARGIEVHCWMVAYRACTLWSPPGNATLAAHPEWLMVPRAKLGLGPAKIGSDYVLDPGCPQVQEYLVSIVRELVADYAVDGIHWDYIRYTQSDAGYPTDAGFADSGLARFRRLYNRADTPPATGDAQWNDFRRQTIDELIRRCQWEIGIRAPERTVKHSAAVVTWGDAPAEFTGSSAYGAFSNWEKWTRLGWLDAICPMTYYREHNAQQAPWYRNWVNKELIWANGRHLYVGPGVYLNTIANSMIQLRYARDAGAQGLATYSYWSTADQDTNGSPENNLDFYTQIATELFTENVPTPAMSWKNLATATTGVVYGKVVEDATSKPLDGAKVYVGGQQTWTDPNGTYMLVLPAVGPMTEYTVTVTYPGLGRLTWNAAVTPAGHAGYLAGRLGLPQDCNANGSEDACDIDCTQPGCEVAGCGLAADCNTNGVPDGCEPDLDGDTVPNACDNCLNLPNTEQADEDGDDVGTACDACQNTAAGSPVDVNGCSTLDGDGDGVLDDFDGCPNDPNKAAPGPCGCGNVEVDADLDGTPDCNDGCPADPAKTAPGQCDCGNVDLDADGDGPADCVDNCPALPNPAQADADGDGHGDGCDACPNTGPGSPTDAHGCAIDDADGDEVSDDLDACPDTPACAIADAVGCPVDDDGDGAVNGCDACPEDARKSAVGACGCGRLETDSDSDGTPDCVDACPQDQRKVAPGQCGCGHTEHDADADGRADCRDNCPGTANANQADADGDGQGDACEPIVVVPNTGGNTTNPTTDGNTNAGGGTTPASGQETPNGSGGSTPSGGDTPTQGGSGTEQPVEVPGDSTPDSGQETPELEAAPPCGILGSSALALTVLGLVGLRSGRRKQRAA